MQNKKLKIVLVLLLACIVILSFFVGRQIPWEQQISMYEALRQTSILIFGLIGAWFAVLLPFALEKKNKLKHLFSFSRKLFPALSSAIYLLIITLIVPFSVNILQSIFSIDDELKSIFRGLSLSIIAVGVVFLFFGLIMILASFDVLKKDIELNEAGADLEQASKPPLRKSTKSPTDDNDK